MQAGEFITLAVWGAIALVMIATLGRRYRGRFGAMMRDALVWVALGAGFLVLYTYRDALTPAYRRTLSELSPGYAVAPAPGVVEVARRRDGHFVIRMKANGRDLPFLFDTGATIVTLRAEDAEILGIDAKKLKFTEAVSTANGTARAALTQLETLSVGDIMERRVQTMVARTGSLNENLLGQNFLDELASYGVENGRLVLRGKAER